MAMNSVMLDKQMVNKFFKYVFANVFAMVALSAYVLADTFFVSNSLGVKGLSSLNFAVPAFQFMNAIGLMLGIGGGTKFMILKTQNDHEGANKVFSNTFYMGLIVGGILMTLGLAIPNQIAYVLGARGDIIPYTAEYLRVVLGLAPFFILNNIMTCFIRNDHAPTLSMASMVVGSLLNVLFDWVFVMVMKWGMWGAALATGFSPMISLIILSFHFICKKSTFKLVKTGFKKQYVGSIFSLGASSFFVEFAFGMSTIILNTAILRLAGNVGVAAYGIVLNVAFVTIALYNGIAQGIQPLISHYYAKTDKRNIFGVALLAILTALVISTLVYLIVYFAGYDISMLFNGDKNATLAGLATRGLKLYFIGFFISGINVVITQTFSSTERAVKSMITSLSRGFLAIVPFMYLMSAFIGLDGVWLSFLVSELFTTCLGVAMMFIKGKKEKAKSERAVGSSDNDKIENAGEIDVKTADEQEETVGETVND